MGKFSKKNQAAKKKKNKVDPCQKKIIANKKMDSEPILSTSSSLFWVYLGVSLFLIVFSGLVSGLTVGYMSLDHLSLHVLEQTGTEKERKQSIALQKITKQHHLLLVTLVLWNAAAVETLPLLLDQLVPSYVAIILSVTFVLIFGEVLPQAIFTGPSKIKLAAGLVPVVIVLEYSIFFLSWPLAKILDLIFISSRKRRQKKRREELEMKRKEREKRKREKTQKRLQQDQARTMAAVSKISATGAAGGEEEKDLEVGGGGGGGGGEGKLGTIVEEEDHASSSRKKDNQQQQHHHHRRHHQPPHQVGSDEEDDDDDDLEEEEEEEEEGYFRRHELKAVIEYHARERAGGRALTEDEVSVIVGALDMVNKRAKDIMTNFDDVFMLPLSSNLDSNLIATIMLEGFSRIPIYGDGGRHDVRGLLLTKRLISVSPEDNRPLRTLTIRRPIVCSPTLPLFALLTEFEKGHSHLALVTEDVQVYRSCLRSHSPVPPSARVLGVVTLEDVIEELIQEEIEDEHDVSRLHTLGTVAVAAQKFKRLIGKGTKTTTNSQSQSSSLPHSPLSSSQKPTITTTRQENEKETNNKKDGENPPPQPLSSYLLPPSAATSLPTVPISSLVVGSEEGNREEKKT